MFHFFRSLGVGFYLASLGRFRNLHVQPFVEWKERRPLLPLRALPKSVSAIFSVGGCRAEGPNIFRLLLLICRDQSASTARLMTLPRPWIVIRRTVYSALGLFDGNFCGRRRPYLHSRALCGVSLVCHQCQRARCQRERVAARYVTGKDVALAPPTTHVQCRSESGAKDALWESTRPRLGGWRAELGRFAAFSALCTVCGLPGSCLLIDLSWLLEHKVRGISACRLLVFFFLVFRVDE